MTLKRSSMSEVAMSFYFGEVDHKRFESQLYENADELENLIGADKYFEIIDCNSSTKNGIENLKLLILNNYSSDRDEIFIDRTINVCERALNGDIDLVEACRIFAELEMAGHNFIPVVFSGYDDELDDGVGLHFYKERIEADIRKLLNQLKCRKDLDRHDCSGQL